MTPRVAVVTGGGRGLGEAFALALAAGGVSVVVNDVDTEAAEAVAGRCREWGADAVADGSPIGSTQSAERLVDVALEAFGRLDAVIANAGIVRDRSIARLSDDDIDDVLATHLRGHLVLLRAAWPHLRTSGAGRVVLVTSAAAFCGNVGQSNYAAAKAGAIGMTQVLALEGQRVDVRVNCIAPIAQTPMAGGVFGPGFAAFSVDDVAPTVVHLAGADCSISGVTLAVGGGLLTRIGFVESRGVRLPVDHTAADVRAQVAAVCDLSNADPVGSLSEHLVRHHPDGAL